jgi:hypothetical protein
LDDSIPLTPLKRGDRKSNSKSPCFKVPLLKGDLGGS